MVGSFARCLLFIRCEGSLNSLVPLSGLGISANSLSRARTSLHTYILLDVLVYNIAVYFYEFCSILTSPQGKSKYKERVKIYSDIVHQNIP